MCYETAYLTEKYNKYVAMKYKIETKTSNDQSEEAQKPNDEQASVNS